MKSKLTALALGASALAFMAFGPAQADPADRVAVAAGVVEAFECDGAINAGGIVCGDINGPIGAGAEIIEPFLYKSNTSADLVFQFTTECTLFNYVKGKSNDNDWETSKAGVIIWIEVDDEETFTDPLIVKVSPADETGADPNGEVTFCNREVGLRVTESPVVIGQVVVELAIKSMGAHAFNWVLQNPAVYFGTNQYYIRVMAAVDLNGSNDSVQGAGFRQRTLIVDSIHLANGTTF